MPDSERIPIADMMTDILQKIRQIIDNGGRRLIRRDRRLFDYTAYIPERRAGMERRSGDDRRRVSD
jgi:hypothetical protein